MSILHLVWISGLYFATCELIDYLAVRKHLAEVFPPKLGWRLCGWFWVAASLIATAATLLAPEAGISRWWALLWAFSFYYWFTWFRTVLVDSSGVSSCGIFGLSRRYIPWGDVSRVTFDWQEESIGIGFDRIRAFLGTRLTVVSRNGVSVEHGVIHGHQGMFLDALKRYLPRQVFDTGVYDWHP
jgi:hypothetical protein